MGEIMIVVTTAILLLLLMLSVVREKNVYNPMTIFLALWSVVCFLAGLKLFGMYDYSYHAPLVVLIGVVSVYLGYIFGSKYKIKLPHQIKHIGIDETREYVVREKLCIVLLFITISVYLIMGISVLALLAAGYDASTIREMYRDSGETAISGMATSLIYGSDFVKKLDSYLAKPTICATIPILSIELTSKGKITKLSALSIVALALSLLVNFGRLNAFVAVACVVVAFFIQGKKLSKKTKRRVKCIATLLLAAMIVFFLLMSNARSTTNSSGAVPNSYAYFSIPIPLLDYWMEQVDSMGAYSLGFSYISGFVANIMNVLARFNIVIPPYKWGSRFNYNLVDHFIGIFPSRRYNAYVSMFFALYLDFREIGVFFGSFIYGCVISRIYNKAKKSKIYLAFYLLLFQGLLWSFIRWQFVIVSYCFAFIFLRILFKRKGLEQE